jgi:hypothetical protein
MYLHSVAAYADQIIDSIDASSMQCLQSMTKDQLALLHHTWGMSIRNEFGLWEPDHPLTKHWHECPDDHDIRNGIDFSEDHPDAVSMRIMLAVWKKVNA